MTNVIIHTKEEIVGQNSQLYFYAALGVIKDLNAIINKFKNKQTFILHSKQSVKKLIQLLAVTRNFGQIEHLYQAINNFEPPQISRDLINRVLYILDEMEKYTKWKE